MALLSYSSPRQMYALTGRKRRYPWEAMIEAEIPSTISASRAKKEEELAEEGLALEKKSLQQAKKQAKRAQLIDIGSLGLQAGFLGALAWPDKTSPALAGTAPSVAPATASVTPGIMPHGLATAPAAPTITSPTQKPITPTGPAIAAGTKGATAGSVRTVGVGPSGEGTYQTGTISSGPAAPSALTKVGAGAAGAGVGWGTTKGLEKLGVTPGLASPIGGAAGGMTAAALMGAPLAAGGIAGLAGAPLAIGLSKLGSKLFGFGGKEPSKEENLRYAYAVSLDELQKDPEGVREALKSTSAASGPFERGTYYHKWLLEQLESGRSVNDIVAEVTDVTSSMKKMEKAPWKYATDKRSIRPVLPAAKAMENRRILDLALQIPGVSEMMGSSEDIIRAYRAGELS